MRRWRARSSSMATTSSPRTASDRDRILRKIGVMYQSGALFGSMTLLENVRLPLEMFTSLHPDQIDLIGRMKLSLVGLAQFTGHLPAEISGGMQKRAAIARAMALDPAHPLPRRAFRRSRSHHVGGTRCADPAPGGQPRRDFRHRHPRAREHLCGRRPCHHARQARQRHHRGGRPAPSARRERPIPMCASSSTARPSLPPPEQR